VVDFFARRSLVGFVTGGKKSKAGASGWDGGMKALACDAIGCSRAKFGGIMGFMWVWGGEREGRAGDGS